MRFLWFPNVGRKLHVGRQYCQTVACRSANTQIRNPLHMFLRDFSLTCCLLCVQQWQGKKIPNLKANPSLKVALMVEPTPFGYICGYSNRFNEMLK